MKGWTCGVLRCFFVVLNCSKRISESVLGSLDKFLGMYGCRFGVVHFYEVLVCHVHSLPQVSLECRLRSKPILNLCSQQRITFSRTTAQRIEKSLKGSSLSADIATKERCCQRYGIHA